MTAGHVRRRARADRGATIVEFAFVFPVLALLFTTLADLGFVVLGGSVASGAARDGARVGIIHYLDADDTSSASFGLVEAAVQKRLVGWIKPGSGAFVTVRCLDGDNPSTVKPCDDAIDIDHDLIEVTVSWEALAATGLLPIDRTQTDTARMVITGAIEDPGGGPVVPGGSTVGFDPTAYAPVETDAPTSTVTLTLTRTSATGTASVNVTTVPGSAGDPGDFVGVTTTANFADGASTTTVDISIVGDDTAEASEAFTVELSNPIGVTLRAGDDVATVTISDDDGATDTTPPSLASPLEMHDADADGRVDQVIAHFDETLGACTATGAWTLVGAPSGAALASVSVAGSTATLTLSEGPGAHDTAVGAFTLALAGSGGICDTAGNNATFAATTPADFAHPVLLTVAEGGGTNGKIENGDVMTLTFSEPIAFTPATSTTSVSDVNPSVMTMAGVLNASVSLGASYASKPLTFANSPVASAGSAITVTLANCSTNGQCSNRALVATSPSVTFAPAPTLADAAGRGAVGSVTLTNVALF